VEWRRNPSYRGRDERQTPGRGEILAYLLVAGARRVHRRLGRPWSDRAAVLLVALLAKGNTRTNDL
jgi:hypothetical protein